MAATVWRTSTSLVSGAVITTTHSPPTSSSHSSYSSPQSVTVDLARKLETSAWLEPGGVTGTAGGVRTQPSEKDRQQAVGRAHRRGS